MSSDILQIVGDFTVPEIEVSKDIFKLRDDLVLQLNQITEIDNSFSAECAADILKNAKQIIKDVEEARVVVKKPALDMGKKIDSVAKEFCSPIEAALKSVSSKLAIYQENERKRLIAEKLKADEESARLAREAEEKASDAEIFDGDEEKAAKIREEARTKITEVQTSALSTSGVIKGVSVRKTTKFEIVDVALLLEKRPDLFSPDEVKIRAALKITKNIPGLNVWEEKTAY